jgi:hypothetical protein
MPPPSLTFDENLDSDAQKLISVCETFDTAAALIGKHSAWADGEEAVAVPQSTAVESAMASRADARTPWARRINKLRVGHSGASYAGWLALWAIYGDSRLPETTQIPGRPASGGSRLRPPK